MFESYGLLAIILLVVGLVLLICEVFLPTGGILAICTTITLCLSLAAAYTAWFDRNPTAWWGFCGLVVLLIPTALGGAFYVFPRTPLGKRALLEAPALESLEPHAQEVNRLTAFIGKYGKTQSLLNPGGIVVVGTDRLHAFSEGQLIDPGTSVEILEVRGTRVLVRPAEPPEQAATTSETLARKEDVLDFELPPE